MALKRDKDIQVNLEEPVFDAATALAKKLDMSASGYARQLIIDDLRARGLLTDRMLADMAMAR